MKLPEHITFSYLLAQFAVQPEHGLGGTALVIAEGCLPDLDGLTIFFGWRFYRKYHRIVGHGLPVTLLGPLGLALLGAELGVRPWLSLWGWLQLALLAHLITDACFYNWPVQLGWPMTSRGVGIGLLRWNDLVPTLMLYGATAVALCWPALAVMAASAGIGGLFLYLLWRARRPRLEAAWLTWLTGGWAAGSLPLWRWLTGDFIT